MSCYALNIRLRHTPNDKTTCIRNIALRYLIIIPVLCECLISAIGKLAGLRHAVFMQFDHDADTEYINYSFAALHSLQSGIYENVYIKN